MFVFIYHHSIPGIIYPIRPQSSINKMFIIANIVGATLLFLEAQLAYWAFSSLTGVPGLDPCSNTFPCAVNPLYNENFLGIPGLGVILGFYPMLNVAAVPILTITLRNNLMQVVPIKRWIRQCGYCQWLLNVSNSYHHLIESLGS